MLLVSFGIYNTDLGNFETMFIFPRQFQIILFLQDNFKTVYYLNNYVLNFCLLTVCDMEFSSIFTNMIIIIISKVNKNLKYERKVL